MREAEQTSIVNKLPQISISCIKFVRNILRLLRNSADKNFIKTEIKTVDTRMKDAELTIILV